MVTVQYCLMSRYFVHSVSPLDSSNAKTHLLQEEDTTTLAHWYVWSRNIWMSAKMMYSTSSILCCMDTTYDFLSHVSNQEEEIERRAGAILEMWKEVCAREAR